MPSHAQRTNSLLASDKFAPSKMPPMFVTLEVSKPSGLSNAAASWNMELMSVTLDVSKSSGWSNAVAP